MNIYFSPTELNELNFPTSSFSTIITNSITKIDEFEKINSKIDDNLSKEDVEISEFYKRYRSKKKLLEKTKSQKKLNKVKVYFIVKSKIVKGKEVRYALPIRNFDDLSNSLLEKSNSFIASLFYLKLDQNINGMEARNESSPGKYPFRLFNLIAPEAPYSDQEEFPLEKNLMVSRKYRINGGKVTLLEPVYTEENTGEDEEDEKFISITYYSTINDIFNESVIDNTFLVTSSNYSTGIRQKNSFKGEKEGNIFLNRLEDINSKEGRFKFFNISNIFSLAFGNINASVDKNIIPVFSNLEDAQDLLITVLDEIHQPFQVRRKIENYYTAPYSKSLKSLSYLDDSFSFLNDYFIPSGLGRQLKRAQNLLMKSKSFYLSKSSGDEFYDEKKYQIKGPSFSKIKNTVVAKSIWRESILDYYFPNQKEAYSWLESRDMTKTDKGLLKKSQDIKILSMGLGDFLEFWNNPTTKNAEVLFIPSSNDLKKKVPLPLLAKRPRDKFYDYQQKFRESKNQDTENYIYEIKLSAE